MSLNDRHSAHNREPMHPHPEEDPHHHHAGAGMSKDKVEQLVEKMTTVGAEYIEEKATHRFGPTERPQGPGAVASGPPPDFLANKIVKESAREMARQEGTVFKGSDAALAQSVATHRLDPQAPEHAVKEKKVKSLGTVLQILERVAGAEEHGLHHTFEGPNPDKGSDSPNAKIRHFRHGGTAQHHVTGGLKKERNPDVSDART